MKYLSNNSVKVSQRNYFPKLYRRLQFVAAHRIDYRENFSRKSLPIYFSSNSVENYSRLIFD